MTILIHGSDLATPFFPQRMPDGNHAAYESSLRTSNSSPSPSDYSALITGSDVPLRRMFGLGVKTIIIDPGHGGADSGATGKMGTMEKDLVLDIAMRLRERLNQYGLFETVMTRNQDETVSLNKRVHLAFASSADLFISIHLNYLPSKPLNIIETYYFGPSADEETLALAAQENAGSHYGLKDFRRMIGKIGDTLKTQESRELASSIQKTLFLNRKKDTGDVHDFGVKKAPFVVLLGVDVPAVLVEVSCLSNMDEERKLTTEEHRDNIAKFLEAGILDYINKGETTYEAKRRSAR